MHSASCRSSALWADATMCSSLTVLVVVVTVFTGSSSPILLGSRTVVTFSRVLVMEDDTKRASEERLFLAPVTAVRFVILLSLSLSLFILSQGGMKGRKFLTRWAW